jgi:serine/threonine protein kinase
MAVLLDTNGNAKVTDFGISRFKTKVELVNTHGGAKGTIPYMAPELLGVTDSGYDEKVIRMLVEAVTC